MRKIYNYIMIAALALAAVGCIDEIGNTDIPTAETGDEVQFGLSLPDAKTRTVYGDELNNAFPIYWVDGDKVQIFSPQALDGRRNAEYQVAVDGPTQNYATSLTKTGSAGVQWGAEYTQNIDGEQVDNLHDFYSLYPSGNYKLSSDEEKAENITIHSSQNVIIDGAIIKSNMEDCLMYARKTAVHRGDIVNLHYDPISTVVYVTLSVAENTDATPDQFTIQSVSLIADTPISGTFSIKIQNGEFVEFTDNSSNTVLAQISDPSTGGFLTLKNGESRSLPLFLAPCGELNVKNWQIKVVANGNTYTKTLNIDKVLEPGQIHKISLPALSSKETEWKVENWMVNIPRNVYLSEVSIPGSWNSINPNFQTAGETDAETIKNQYNLGVRAFHLDTRWKAQYSTGGYGTFQKVLGLGVADDSGNGNSWSGTITSGDKYTKGNNTPLVEDIISQLVSYIKDTPQEYVVLVCSFAQESINHEGDNGFWYGEISAICNKSEYAGYIVDGSKVNANTLVGDVLGKILVIVNMQDTISSTTTLPNNSKCVFVNIPSELPSTRFTSTDPAKIIENNSDELWVSTTATTFSGITIYDNQAQITSSTGDGISHNRGYAPSVNERTAVLNTILDWSKSNYGTDNYAHDAWIYLGLGGYQVAEGGSAGTVSGSYSTIASTYNNWINNRVTAMGIDGAPYYPVGIVLMNYVDTYSSTVKNILLLNNKYQLVYDSNKPVDYVGNVDTGGSGEGGMGE